MVQLIKLEVEGFGKFDKEKVISFGNGINFITGLNEVGKSTILEAILASIFKYTKSQIGPFFSWKNKNICRTALTYKTDKDGTFRIISDYKSGKRRLEKIEKTKTKEIAAVDKNINPYLKEHFGFDDKKAFENTAFIRQSQMAILEDNSVRNKIKDMIEEVFAGRSEASATKALAKIRKAVKDCTKEIDDFGTERDELKDKLKSAEETKEKIGSESMSYEKTTKELGEKSEKLNKLKENQKRFQEKEGLMQEQESLNEKIKKIDKVIVGIKENIKKKDSVAEKFEKYKGYDKISDSDFEDIKKSIKDIEKSETTLSTLKKSSRKKKVVEEKLNLPYVILFILGLLLSVILIGIPLAIYAYKRMKIKEEKEITDEDKEAEIVELTEKISSTNKNLITKCRGIKDFNINSFPDDFNKYNKLLEENKHLSTSINELAKAELEKSEVEKDEEENLRKIEAKKNDYLNKITITQNNLKKYKLLTFKQEDFDELDPLDKRVEELKRIYTELKTSIKTTTSLVESPEEIKEKLDVIDENKLNLLKKIEEHEIAAKFLELAETQVHHKFTPAIEKNSKPILKEITNERYSDLKIEEETLDIKVKAPETKEYVDIFFLSQGARDQLYFTLRTVMSDLLGKDTNIPLILDDPFHNFDDTRLKKTIDAIKQLAKNKQIILISHRPYHKEFKNFCENVIEL